MQVGWWSGDRFKYVSVRTRIGLELFPTVSSGAGMEMRILCGYGCGGTILIN